MAEPTDSNNLSNATPVQPNKVNKIIKGIIISLISLVALVFIAIEGLSIYLTPARLTEIVNREGSKYLKADLKADNVDYTFWSTFPRLCITVDSISVISRSLKNTPAQIRKELPKDCDFLASTGKIRASVNIWKAIKGEIELNGISISAPTLNLIAYNDTINNYSIFPPLRLKDKVPHISFDTIYIQAPLAVSFKEIVTDTEAEVRINDLIISENRGADKYHIFTSGIVDGEFGEVGIPEGLPLQIDGDIEMRFNPLGVNLSDFKISIPDLATALALDVSLDGKPKINDFSSNIKSADIMAVLSHFSLPLPKSLNSIESNLPIDLSILLTKPFFIPTDFTHKTSLEKLPCLNINLDVTDASLKYKPKGKRQIAVNNINISASSEINPEDTSSNILDLKKCSLSSDGSEIDITAKIRDLLSNNPLIDANVYCNADISELVSTILPSGLKIEGKFNGNTSLSCRIADLTGKELKDLNVTGKFRSNGIKITDRKENLTANISGISFDLNALFPSLTPNSLTNGKINIRTSARKAIANNAKESSEMKLDNLSLNIRAGAGGQVSNPTLAGNVLLQILNTEASTPDIKLHTSGLAVTLKGSLRHTPWTTTQQWVQPNSSADGLLISNRINHTPLILTPSISPMLQTMLSLLNLSGDLKISEGSIFTDHYPAANSFSGVHMTTDLDTLVIAGLHIGSRSTEGNLKGRVKDLRQFLLSQTPSLLKVNLEARFSDVNINELAGTYYSGVSKTTGKPVSFKVPNPGPYTAADSLCIAIPRNISADVSLYSDRAEYQEWTFHPLSTVLSTHDGVARIGDLTIGSDFCNAYADWIYSTEDFNKIFMQIKLRMNSFDFNRFFTAFPGLIEKTPELRNLSGNLSAEAEGKFLMFPSMFLNVPSLKGTVTLNGNDIEYKRDKKLARITHIFLLKGDGPLKVEDFTANANFHDNLLRLEPFNIRCGGYELMIGGVNNLQGEIYYHVGLMHSPFHFPFGINLVGNFHHPELRFGGKEIHDGRERKISADLGDSVNINIMRQLKQGWLLFIENAAKYDMSDNHTHISDVH